MGRADKPVQASENHMITDPTDLSLPDKFIGEIVRERRKTLGLSASEVAEYAGLHRSAYSRIERDPKANPTMHTLGPILAKLRLEFGLCLITETICPKQHVKPPLSETANA